jgi:molybdenum cofactor cytidylyltransferase
VARALASGAAIAAPLYRGRRGHPVGFAREFFPQLLQLSGDQSARAILQAHAARMKAILTTDAGVLCDIDMASDINEHCEST